MTWWAKAELSGDRVEYTLSEGDYEVPDFTGYWNVTMTRFAEPMDWATEHGWVGVCREGDTPEEAIASADRWLTNMAVLMDMARTVQAIEAVEVWADEFAGHLGSQDVRNKLRVLAAAGDGRAAEGHR